MRTLLTAGWLLSCAATAGWCGKINWQFLYEKGLLKAQRNHALIVVYMLAGWNRQCKDFERTTLQDPRVVAALDGLVCIKIDGEEEPDLAALFQVYGYPTLVFLNTDEEVIGRIGGLTGVPDLCAKIGLMKTMEETYQRLRQEIVSTPGDPQINFALASLYLERGKHEKALQLFADVVKLDSVDTAGYTGKARLLRAYCLVEMTQYNQALAELATYEQTYPQSALGDQMLLYRGLAYFHAGNLSAAKRSLDELVRRFPASRLAEQAREIIGTIDEQK
jgi:thioredoxin-like negative regulator of GroEL